MSQDEAVLFDHFFYSVISPLFYIETLADLEKKVREGRTPEQEVGIIADKAPELHGGPCSHHAQLVLGNLYGHPVPMDGNQIPIATGRPVKLGSKKGFIVDTTNEAKAFHRWQDREFLEVERNFAKIWRRSLEECDEIAIAGALKTMGVNEKPCRDLSEAKELADSLLGPLSYPDFIKATLIFLKISPTLEKDIIEEWKKAGKPHVSVYSPYAFYVLKIQLFFQIALANQLLFSGKVSNKTDIAYLYYLPFCMVFVSSDRLQKRTTSLFLQPHQSFVWGENLKKSLELLRVRYSQLPQEELEKGLLHFAAIPPDEKDCLISELWDKHLAPGWRNMRDSKPDSEEAKKLIEEMKQLNDQPTLKADEVDFEMDSADVLSIQRKVRQKKGSFWQLPKNLKSD